MKKKSKNYHLWLKQTLSEFNKSLSLITDIVQLNNNFKAHIKEITQVTDIKIFLLNPDNNRFTPIENNTISEKKSALYFLNEDKLVFWLNVNKTYLILKENKQVFSFFTKREQELLNHLKVTIIYPYIIMNRVKGIVLLGEKTHGEYSKDELEMLITLFEQAGFAFENTLLYQQQKERARKMYRADRLATLGELAAGAAHEIRNPLTSIRSTIQYLKNKITDDEDKDIINDLLEEVDRINEIIQDMLSFAKKEDINKREINLKLLINQILSLVNNVVRKKNIIIKIDYDTNDEIIFADQGQLKQVLLNIVMNAIQSIDKPDGTISISVKSIQDKPYHNKNYFTYLIEITDTGKGISSKNIDKIFDPFYTTKSEGTGLGLTITYNIINKHSGDIEIDSKKEIGTTVRIKLPNKK